MDCFPEFEDSNQDLAGYGGWTPREDRRGVRVWQVALSSYSANSQNRRLGGDVIVFPRLSLDLGHNFRILGNLTGLLILLMIYPFR